MTSAEHLESLLATSPREIEAIDLRAAETWSQAERDAAAARLVAAAKNGDARAVHALSFVLPDDRLAVATQALLFASSLSVRIAASAVAADALRRQTRAGLEGDLVAGQADPNLLRDAARVLIAQDGEAAVRSFVERTQTEEARTQYLKALWVHHHFDRVPVVWWRGLGLLRWQLDLPLPSFRTAAIAQFYALADGSPAAIPAEPDSPSPPDGLLAAMQDARGGAGPLDEAALRALSDGERDALVVYAATKALDLQSERCLDIVALLSDAQHRDLFERAAASPHQSFAAAAQRILAATKAN